MRIAIFSFSVLLLALSSTLALAGGYDYEKEDLSGYSLQPDLQVHDEGDYSRDGHAVYLFGGYAFSQRFLSDSHKTIYTLTGASTHYIPSKAVPEGLHGLQVGVGKELSRRVDFQASYIQFFSDEKTSSFNGSTYRYKVKSNGVLGDIAYIFNPYDQFQILFQAGAMLLQTTNSISVGGVSYFTNNDSTKIDPAAGLEFLIQFTKHLGVRTSMLYVMESQSTNSHGEIMGLAALNYVV